MWLLLSRQCAIAGQLLHAIAVALEQGLDGANVHACHGFVEARRERRLEETHQLEDGLEVFAEEISPVVVKLMMLLKAHALSLGYSGVQLITVQRIIDFFNNDIIPMVIIFPKNRDFLING